MVSVFSAWDQIYFGLCLLISSVISKYIIILRPKIAFLTKTGLILIYNMKSVVLFHWERALCCFGFREEADKIRPVRICKHKAVLRYCAWCLFQQLHYCRQLSAPNWSSKQLPFKITKPVLFYLHTFCVVYRIHPTPTYYWIFLEGCLFFGSLCAQQTKLKVKLYPLYCLDFPPRRMHYYYYTVLKFNFLLVCYCAGKSPLSLEVDIRSYLPCTQQLEKQFSAYPWTNQNSWVIPEIHSQDSENLSMRQWHSLI